MNSTWSILSTLVLSVMLGGCAKQGPRASTPPSPTGGSTTTNRTTTDASTTTSSTSNPDGQRQTATESTTTDRTTASSQTRKTTDSSTAATTATTSSGDSTTLTGCLSKGDVPNTYVLTDEKTGMKTQVTGTADLEKHSANHKVTLTGTRGSSNAFTTTKIQHIAATCQASSTP